jgi:hypothetical protein
VDLFPISLALFIGLLLSWLLLPSGEPRHQQPVATAEGEPVAKAA